MANESTIAGIAERLCKFLKDQHRDADLARLALRLSLDERGLRDFLDRDPTSLVDPVFLIELLVAVVREYGVDCGYLLTGSYSFDSHCRIEEELRDLGQLREHLSRQLSTLSWS